MREEWVEWSGIGCFFEVWIYLICKSYQALYPLQTYPKGNCILYKGHLRIYFGLCCQHMWKETNMFTISILSWIRQIPSDNTHRKTHAYSGCPSMSSSNTMFPSQSEAKGTASLLIKLVVYLGQMHLQPTVPWTKLFIRFSTTITIQ